MRLARSNRGQASVMIGMMMLTFLLFFTFVVNTGMLVSAKINLQNAADLAAYAGAATQARQLNDISYLNYEMRRAYKKFLFRYYVIGNLAQKGFPPPAAKNPHMWSPDGTPANDYGVPTVCLVFKQDDNFCQLAKLPTIPFQASSGTNPDQISATLNDQLSHLEYIRQLNCGKIGGANLQVLLLWLYNSDPKLERLPTTLTTPDQQATMAVTQAVSYGLGLVPKEILLRQRIKTLEGYVNEGPNQGLSIDTINTMRQSADPAGSERSIQAFLSAYNTLGDATFGSSIQMDELVDGSGGNGNLLALKDIKISFDTYAVGYTSETGAGIQLGVGSACLPSLAPVPVRSLPVGVYKDPSILTYYAVRLKGTAKIMFSPFGDMNLKAYSAARPFGSRIGPPLDDTAFTHDGLPNSISKTTGPNLILQQQLAKKIPNLPLAIDDTSSVGNGFDSDLALASYYQAMFPSGGGGGGASIGPDNAVHGIEAAMAPNPIEGPAYNIMNDKVTDPLVLNFDTTHIAAFWAPIDPPGKTGSIQSDLQTTLTDIFAAPPSNAQSFDPSAGANTSQLRATLLSDLLNYIGTLPAQQGENGEGMNTAKVQDPFTGSDGKPIVLGSKDLEMTDPKQYRTSWVNENDSSYQALGRVGYSVKFVSFDSLIQHTSSADGTTQFVNAGSILDEEAKTDGINQIQH